MGTITDPMVQELLAEADATRRVLERVPADRLEWKPHERSMTLGQLALHVASTPGDVAELAMMDDAPLPDFGVYEQPSSKADVLERLEASLRRATEILGSCADEQAAETFRLMAGDREVMAVPRVGLIRSILLNHWYHHRGQLTVYLRMLDVPVPAVYGVSADENPFEEATGSA